MTNKRHYVDLSVDDFSIACHIAEHRCIDSIRNNRADRLYSKQWEENYMTHLLGACGELAFSKWRGLYPTMGVREFAGMKPDVGSKYEVRHRSNPNWDLIIRYHDRNDRIYILTRGHLPTIEIAGWGWPSELKKEKWYMNHGGYGYAYFIPAVELNPMEDLPLDDTK